MENILDLFRLDGKKAIVTGGAGGLGWHLTEALLEAGAEVVMTGVTERVFAAARELQAMGLCAYGVRGDLADTVERERVFGEAMGYLAGDVDILVNCAGVQHRCRAETFPEEQWQRVLGTNLDAAFFLSQKAGRIMLQKGCGKIINICSISAVFGGMRIPAYVASKCGMYGITKSLSNEWAGKGIQVNAIAPGYMKTELTESLRSVENQVELVNARIPKGRWGTGKDLKGAVVYLASAASDYVNGSMLTVDGGFSCF